MKYVSKTRITESLNLFLFILFIFAIGWRFYWLSTPPSDPLEYVGPALEGSTIGFWPWLDRINLASALRLFTLATPIDSMHIGPAFGLTVTLLTLFVSGAFLYYRIGFIAALIFFILALSSNYIYFFMTQVFAEPLLVLLSALSAFAMGLFEIRNDRKWVYVCGFFAATCMFTKITGIAVIISIVVYLALSKKIKNVVPLLCGFLIGLAASALAFVVFYGASSLMDTIRSFFSIGVQQNLTGRPGFNNAVSFWDAFFQRTYFPVFLSALIFSGFYRTGKARLFATVGWSYFLVVYIIYWLSGRGYTAIPNYVYPAYFFFLLALCCVLAESLTLPTTRERLRLTALVLSLWLLGYWLSQDMDPATVFNPGYFPQLSPAKKFILNGALMTLVGLTLLSHIRASSTIICSFLLTTAFWGGSYGAAQAGHLYKRILIPEADSYYNAANVLGHVKCCSVFDIYIPEWGTEIEQWRLLWVYRVFYAHHRTDHPTGDNRYQSWEDLIKKSIGRLNASELPASTRALLTTKPLEVETARKGLQVLEQFKFQGIEYFVMGAVR